MVLGDMRPMSSAALLWLAVFAAWGLAHATAMQQVTPRSEIVVQAPAPPVFPNVFMMKYEFSMPHFYLTQPKGLSYPVSVWYDEPNNRQRVEAYDGEDTVVSVGGYDYTVMPRISVLDCDVFGNPERLIYNPLPDMSRWDYGGSLTLDGRTANVWQRQIKEGNKVSQHTFYVTPEGVPLRLNSIGINILTSSHFDEYVYDFKHFEAALPNNASASLFGIPDLCTKKMEELAEKAAAEEIATTADVAPAATAGSAAATAATTAAAATGGAAAAAAAAVPLPREERQKQELGGRRQHPAAWQLASALPNAGSLDHAHTYNLWSRAHGRVHEHAQEYDERLEQFKNVVQRVQEHNARPDASFRLRLNQWADWHESEFTSALLPNMRLKPTVTQRADGSDVLISELPLASYRPRRSFSGTPGLKKDELPASVDWRGTGADPGIKDQGMCGSCFSFAATGAMDGTWFVATGQRRSFSEQQIVDCSWDYGPNGCFGGYYQPVFNYVAENGGIAMEQDYSYRGEVGYCRAANHSMGGHFEGYMNVKSRSEEALMEAVWKYGPVAVSVYADLDTFRFYSEGVYDEPGCSTKMRDLDHTVTLFGYGNEGGKDYWLVRNSWSKYYGDDGYIKIVRGSNDCGIATDAAVPLVEARLVRQEAQEAARQAAARWE